MGPGLGEGLSVYTLCPEQQKHVELISKISFKRVGNQPIARSHLQLCQGDGESQLTLHMVN